ncbi:MAG: hypothetical protein WKF75_00325 [Singulisphaera sp.]
MMAPLAYYRWGDWLGRGPPALGEGDTAGVRPVLQALHGPTDRA